jgi:hypothetical protein
LLGQAAYNIDGVPIAPEAPQGTIFEVIGGVERVLHEGTGQKGVERV